MNRFVIDSIVLVNNERLFNTTSRKEIALEHLSDKKIICAVGGNGSGKSTIIQEIFPFPIYGRYLKDEIGRKIITMVNGDNEKLIIEYIFEPNGDTHKCSCYVYKEDGNGNRLELNPEGKLGLGMDAIYKELNIDNTLGYLFQMSSSEITLVNKTPAERRIFMQKVLSDISSLTETSKKLNEKKLIINNMITVNDKSLSSISDTSIIESNIEFVTNEINQLREDYESANKLAEKRNNLLTENDKLKSSIQNIEKDIEFYNKKVLPFMAKSEIINTDHNVFSYRRYLNDRIETLSANIRDDEDEILMLNSVNEKISLKDRLKGLYKDIGEYDYDYYSMVVESMSEDDLKIIDTMDIDTANRVKHVLDTLKATLVRYSVYDNIRAIRLNLGLDSSATNLILNNHKDRVVELHKEKDMIIKKVAENNIVGELKKLSKPKCSDCDIMTKILEVDADIESLYTRMRNIDNEIVGIGEDRDDYLRVQAICDDLNTVIHTMDRSSDIKSIYPDWDTWYIIDNNLLDDMLIDINSKIKQIKDLAIYKKIDEYSKLEKSISDIDNVELTNRSSRLEKLYERKNNNDKLLMKYNESFGLVENFISVVTNSSYDADILSMTYSSVNKQSNILTVQKDKLLSIINNNNDEISMLKLRLEKTATLEDQISDLENTLNKLTGSLALRDKLSEDNTKLREVQEDITITHKITSSILINKVIHRFMYIIKDISNKIYEDINLPYRIKEIGINDIEFTISILDTNTGILSPDVSCMSSGEKAINGFVLTLALQELLDTKYNVVTLDEVDAALDDTNRVKFIDILSKYVNIYNKQIFIISHNNNLSILNDKIGYIVLNGAKNTIVGDLIFKLESGS